MIVPVVIVNISLWEQRLLVAQHTIDINNGALFVQNSCARYIVIVQGPNAFIEFIAHMRESYGSMITISIDIIFIEGAECLTND